MVFQTYIHIIPNVTNYLKLIIVAPRPILGNVLVLAGQLFLAGMFVFEEKILKDYDVIKSFFSFYEIRYMSLT